MQPTCMNWKEASKSSTGYILMRKNLSPIMRLIVDWMTYGLCSFCLSSLSSEMNFFLTAGNLTREMVTRCEQLFYPVGFQCTLLFLNGALVTGIITKKNKQKWFIYGHLSACKFYDQWMLSVCLCIYTWSWCIQPAGLNLERHLEGWCRGKEHVLSSHTLRCLKAVVSKPRRKTYWPESVSLYQTNFKKYCVGTQKITGAFLFLYEVRTMKVHSSSRLVPPEPD